MLRQYLFSAVVITYTGKSHCSRIGLTIPRPSIFVIRRAGSKRFGSILSSTTGGPTNRTKAISDDERGVTAGIIKARIAQITKGHL